MGADYNLFLALLKKTGKKTSDVAKATGISPSVFSDWKSGRYSPKMDKLQKIADYFNISVDYFAGKQEYYEDAEARILADFLKENSEYRVLFDAMKTVKPEDIEFVRQFIERMGGKS